MCHRLPSCRIRIFKCLPTRRIVSSNGPRRLNALLRWREAGQVERSFWRETGAAGFLGVTVPEAYGGPGRRLSPRTGASRCGGAAESRGLRAGPAQCHRHARTFVARNRGAEAPLAAEARVRRTGLRHRDERTRARVPISRPFAPQHAATATAIESTARRPSFPTDKLPISSSSWQKRIPRKARAACP